MNLRCALISSHLAKCARLEKMNKCVIFSVIFKNFPRLDAKVLFLIYFLNFSLVIEKYKICKIHGRRQGQVGAVAPFTGCLRFMSAFFSLKIEHKWEKYEIFAPNRTKIEDIMNVINFFRDFPRKMSFVPPPK